jgi:diacylglycerol kinase family enzyme
VDVGCASINGDHAAHFLLMAGLGLDGSIMAGTSRALKNRIGKLAVGVAAVERLPTLHAVPMRIDLDGVSWHGQALQVVIGNTRLYGGFTSITPDAFMDDGLLDVCLFTPDGVAGAAKQALSLAVRKRPSEASAELYRAAHVEIRAACPVPLQLDGGVVDQKEDDPGPEGSVYDFKVVPRALTVLVPRTYDGDLLKFGFDLAGSPDGKKGKSKRKKHA